jgi:hypothetical protein
MFALNHNASYQGLSSLFPLRSISSLIFVIILSRSSFSHSFNVHPYHLRVVFLYCACLYHDRKPSSQSWSLLKQSMSYWKHMISHVFEDLRRRKAPNRRLDRSEWSQLNFAIEKWKMSTLLQLKWSKHSNQNQISKSVISWFQIVPNIHTRPAKQTGR